MAVEAELVVHNREDLPEDCVTEFAVITMSVNKADLAREEWPALREMYLDGLLRDARLCFTEWLDKVSP